MLKAAHRYPYNTGFDIQHCKVWSVLGNRFYWSINPGGFMLVFYLWPLISVPETSELPEVSMTNRLIELGSAMRHSGIWCHSWPPACTHAFSVRIASCHALTFFLKLCFIKVNISVHSIWLIIQLVKKSNHLLGVISQTKITDFWAFLVEFQWQIRHECVAAPSVV